MWLINPVTDFDTPGPEIACANCLPRPIWWLYIVWEALSCAGEAGGR